MLKILGLCISFLVIGITFGLPAKDIDDLIYHLEEIKQQNHYDEPYDHVNVARPIAYKADFWDNSNSFKDGYNGEIVPRSLDGLERTLANAYQLYNLERRMNNLLNAHHHLPVLQQLTSSQQKEPVQNVVFSQVSPALNQHQLKRAIDPIGGANLLKRAVDRIGGGNLLKRR